MQQRHRGATPLGKVSTRVNIDEQLWRWAKAQALLNSKTVGEIVEDALRDKKQSS